MATFFPLRTNFASGRSMGGHPFGNLSFSRCSYKPPGSSSLSILSPTLSFSVGMTIDRSCSWLALFHGRIARQNSIVHRCWLTKQTTFFLTFPVRNCINSDETRNSLWNKTIDIEFAIDNVFSLDPTTKEGTERKLSNQCCVLYSKWLAE